MKAILEEQLEEILTKLGVWEDFSTGAIKCSKCNKVIDAINLGIIIPRREVDGRRSFEFYCNDPDCINDIIKS